MHGRNDLLLLPLDAVLKGHLIEALRTSSSPGTLNLGPLGAALLTHINCSKLFRKALGISPIVCHSFITTSILTHKILFGFFTCF